MLLHGLAATGSLNWMPALAGLAARFRVLIVDHRGHGRGIRTRKFQLADCADDVVAMADVLGLESVLAVGYSMGGPIAKLCWLRHRDRVRGLVLCATARNFLRPGMRNVATAVLPGAVMAARMMPNAFRTRITKRLLANARPGPTRDHAHVEMARMDPATVMQATREVARFSSRDWVQRIDVPTAVLVMTRDTLVPARRQYRLASAIPNARVFEVDADHLACAYAVDRFVPALVDACTYVDAEALRPHGSAAHGTRP